MTEINPYDQGFRDALLTVKAALDGFERDMPAEDFLGKIAANIEAQLAKSDLDLWHLFAVAQVDLSAHPEAQALRAMLRAPTGVLIDGDGRMLFLRLNGTEYDTGVLKLKEEVASLETASKIMNALAGAPKFVTITINGRDTDVLEGVLLTYDQIVLLSGGRGVTLGYTVTYRGEGKVGLFSGTMCSGSAISACSGMVFNVALTGGA